MGRIPRMGAYGQQIAAGKVLRARKMVARLRKSEPEFLRSLCIFLLLVLPGFDLPTAFCRGTSSDVPRSSELQTLVEKQEAHLQRLENLIDALDRTVNRLKSPETTGPADESRKEAVEKPAGKRDGADSARRGEADYGYGKGMTVARYRPAWSERFQFLSAVRVATEVTCVNILPHDGEEGVSKYVAVGDEQGRVYIFLSGGDVLVDFLTLSASPVTAMLSYVASGRNETVLVTGHADGAILVHRLWEMTAHAGQAVAAGEDWHVLAMEQARVLVPPGGENSEPDFDASVTLLEVHQVGKMRYILGADRRGRIRVFRENGTLYGVAAAPSRPLAFLRQRLLFLTETGAGSLDLRSMTVRKADCDGLNGSRAVAYAFDASERSKGYGFTAEGDLIHVVLLGDILNFECRVRARRRAEIDGPLAVQTIKGYLLVGNSEKVFVYNTTSQSYVRVGGPRPLFYAPLEEIVSAFVNSLPVPARGGGSRRPLIACNRERLVVLGLGQGYVGMYRSNLPVYKAEFNTVLWSSPILVFVLFLAGAWQFFGKKREAFSIWGLEEQFNNAAGAGGGGGGSGGGSSASAVSAERAYDDPARERRESLRAPARRYGSPPSRYPPGGALSYRAAAVDPNFRAQAVEPGGYCKRREPLFSSNQVVEENIH